MNYDIKARARGLIHECDAIGARFFLRAGVLGENYLRICEKFLREAMAEGERRGNELLEALELQASALPKAHAEIVRHRERAQKAEAELAKLKSEQQKVFEKVLDPEWMKGLTANEIVVEAIRRTKAAEAERDELKRQVCSWPAADCHGCQDLKAERDALAALVAIAQNGLRDVVRIDAGAARQRALEFLDRINSSRSVERARRVAAVVEAAHNMYPASGPLREALDRLAAHDAKEK